MLLRPRDTMTVRIIWMGTDRNTTKRQAGFTLIEVVLVLAIGSLIFLLAFIAFSQVQRNRRDSGRRAFLTYFVAELINYQQTHGGTFPVSYGTLTSNNGHAVNIPNKDETALYSAYGSGEDKLNMDSFVNSFIKPGNTGDPSQGHYRLARGSGVNTQTGDVHYNGDYGRCAQGTSIRNTTTNQPTDAAVSIVLETGARYCRDL